MSTINEKIVDDVVTALNESLKRHNVGYGEELHNMLLRKIEDIGEEAYRRWLGKR